MKVLPRGDRLPALLLALLVVLLFRESLLAGGVFYKRDVHLVWHPQTEGFVRAVASGAWPVWDPSPAFGQPLLADPAQQILYPPTWLNLVLRPWTYYMLFAFGHVLLSGLAFYALGRRWGASPLAAWSGAALWVLSGPFLSLVDLWHHFASTAWMPVVFLAAERALEGRRPRQALLLGLALGLQILGGSADACAITLLALGVQVAFLHVEWRGGWRANRHLVVGGALALAVAVALSAGLWLPALEVVSRSARRELPEAMRTYWSVHPLGMLETLAPGLPSALPLAPAWRAALYESREPFLSSLYLGLPAAALGFAALAVPGSRRRWVLAGLVVGGVVFALGRHTPAYEVAVAVLPPLRVLRYPVKVMALVAFAWSALGALGVDAWRSPALPPRRRWGLCVVLPLAVLALAAATAAAVTLLRPELWRPLVEVAVAVGNEAPPLGQVLRPLAVRLAVGAVLAALAALLAVRRLRGRAGPLLAVAVATLWVGDLANAPRRPNPVAPRELYTHRPEVLRLIGDPGAARIYSYDYSDADRARRWLGRPHAPVLERTWSGWPPGAATALGMQMSLVPQTAGRWGLRQAFDIDYRGLHADELARLTRLLRLEEGGPGVPRLLEIGAVTHVVSLHDAGFEALRPVGQVEGLFREEIRVFAVPNTLPRAYVVGGVRVADGIAGFEVLLDPGFDPRREVLLPAGSPSATPSGFWGRCRIASERADRVRIEAELGADGHVVLVDGYDPGWRVTLDGRPAPLLRANMAFRAVAVPAGRHVVEMVYRPPAVLAGLLLSGLTALTAAALLFSSSSTPRAPSRSQATGEGRERR